VDANDGGEHQTKGCLKGLERSKATRKMNWHWGRVRDALQSPKKEDIQPLVRAQERGKNKNEGEGKEIRVDLYLRVEETGRKGRCKEHSRVKAQGAQSMRCYEDRDEPGN